MESTQHVTIEHVVIASNQPYEVVLKALESRLGSMDDWKGIAQKIQSLVSEGASWEQVAEEIEAHIGTSGLALFNRVEHTPLLTLAGKTSRAVQYTAGNPLLAIQMTRLRPEAALYAPLRFVVYEDEKGQTFVAYDNFVSLLAQYQSDEIIQVARIVEQKLEALLVEVTR